MNATFTCKLCKRDQEYDRPEGATLAPNICDICDARWLANLKLFDEELKLCVAVSLMKQERRQKVLNQWKHLSERNQTPGPCAYQGQLTTSQMENAKRHDMMIAEVNRLTS